jgi:prophage DNA circulation protein
MVLGDLLGGVGDLLGAAANPFGLPSKSEWNLLPGKFQPADGSPEVSFFVEDGKKESRDKRTGLEQATDSGGRRLAIYEYPYRDGQDVDDLGRRGEKWTFNITFFGSNYQELFRQFVNVIVRSKARGTLTHPIRGQIKARFSEYEFIHRHDQFNSVTIRATFIEDNTDALKAENTVSSSSNSALRSALKLLNDAQGTIGAAIFAVGALLLLPNAVLASLKARLDSISGALSRLLGKTAATFSTDAQLQGLAASTSGVSGGSGGVTTTGETLPPVFQVGFSEQDLETIESQVDSFTNQNQITAQQLVYQMNQVRTQIASAIAEIEQLMGTEGFEIVFTYRQLAVQFQAAIEAAIASAQAKVKLYTVPFDMSLRQVAFANGLDPDRQNDIIQLNPNVESANLVPRGSRLVVPAT